MAVTLVTDNEECFELQSDEKILTFPPRPGGINSSKYTQECLLSPEKIVNVQMRDNPQPEVPQESATYSRKHHKKNDD